MATDAIKNLAKTVRAELSEILQDACIDRTFVWRCPHCDTKNLLTWDDGRAYTATCMDCNRKTKVYRSTFRRKN